MIFTDSEISTSNDSDVHQPSPQNQDLRLTGIGPAPGARVPINANYTGRGPLAVALGLCQAYLGQALIIAVLALKHPYRNSQTSEIKFCISCSAFHHHPPPPLSLRQVTVTVTSVLHQSLMRNSLASRASPIPLLRATLRNPTYKP